MTHIYADIPEMRRQLRVQAASIRGVVERLQKQPDSFGRSGLIMDWIETANSLEHITGFPVLGETPVTRRQRIATSIARHAPWLAARVMSPDPITLEHIDGLYMQTKLYLGKEIELTSELPKAQLAKELIEKSAKRYINLVCGQYRAQYLAELKQPDLVPSH